MKLKFIMCKGLPGSGKTTWAKELIEYSKEKWKRVNKDDLREMLDSNKYSKENEQFIIKMQNNLIWSAFENGYHVVCDDTNLVPKHKERFEKLIADYEKQYGTKIEFQIQDFTNVELEECIKRDLHRQEKTIGEKVIRDMYLHHIKPYLVTPELDQDPNLPKAIICDIDGTIAKNVSRGWFDWDRVDEDHLHKDIYDLLSMFYSNGYYIIFVSGRDSICIDKTKKWISDNMPGIFAKQHEGLFWSLYMRDVADNRSDDVVKSEIFYNHIYNRWKIDYVIDDRNKVVKMWRAIGLRCLQVAEGNF